MTTTINNKHKKLNVPNLRFPEFQGEWEKCPLGKISTKITKKNKGNTIQNVLCNSATLGLIPQNDYFDREIANSNNTDGYYVIEYGDFVYNPRKSVSAPYGPVNIYTGSIKGIISPLYLCFSVHSIMPSFLYYRFKSSVWFPYVYSHGDTGTRFDRVSIKDDVFFEMPIYMPSSKEQIKIANLMALLDERIATQNKIIDKLQSLIKGIRNDVFGKLRKNIGFNAVVVDVLDYEQPQSYIVEDTEYTNEGTPVLTANKAFVLGYTLETDGIYDKGDCIIFDDFTLDCKYVDFPFKVKSSAIKILTAKNKELLRYTFEFLKYLDLSTEEHKRHYIAETQNQEFILPTMHIVSTIAHTFSALSLRMESVVKQRNMFETQKLYLLRQMFI